MAITFWQLPADELVRLQFLHDNGAVAIKKGLLSEKEGLRPFSVLDIPQTETVGPFVLTREEFVDTLVRKPPLPPQGDRVFIDYYDSCVVSYRPGGRIRGMLKQSHTSFDKGFWNKGEWITKPDAFVKWAAKIHKWIRTKHATEKAELSGFSYSATPAVVDATKKKRLKLMLG